MKLQVISVYDAKSKAYSPPMTFVALGTATRSFEDEVNNPQSPYNKHPEDYTLFHLGEYDDNNAVFTPLETPYSLGVATVFKTDAA